MTPLNLKMKKRVIPLLPVILCCFLLACLVHYSFGPDHSDIQDSNVPGGIVVGNSLPSIKKTKKTAMDLLRDNLKHKPVNIYANMQPLDKDKLKFINENPPDDPMGLKLQLGRDYFRSVLDVLQGARPELEALDTYRSDERIYHAGYDVVGKGPALSKEYLSQFLQLSSDEVSQLKTSHAAVVNHLPISYPPSLYKGNGVVYVGGGRFNWLVLLSIKTLRSLGSKLPVEVLIPTFEEYEMEVCSRILPALDAKCIYLPHLLGEDATKALKFSGYQYKSLALILSSFENVLLLDADNSPLQAPDYLFESEPFVGHGMIIWPDFWKRTTSPSFYDIIGIDVKEDERLNFGFKEYGETYKPNSPPDEGTPLHQLKGAIPDPSSESGQLMISKETHLQTMFLALYYNLYGPDFFYPLFSQGSDGEGDKETFIAAAHVLGKPFYQVKKFVQSLGRFVDHEYVGSAMGQFNPNDDYSTFLRFSGKEIIDERELSEHSPKLMFVHSNFPKLDPWELKETETTYDSETGRRNRLYGTGLEDIIGFDFETIQWKNMKFYICDLKLKLKCFEDKGVNNQELCLEIVNQLEYLFSTSM